MGSIGYGSRIVVNRTKTTLSPTQKIAATGRAQEVQNRVEGTDYFFDHIIFDSMKEHLKSMGIGYFEDESNHEGWKSNIIVGISGDPEIIKGDASVNNGAPTIRFKFHLTSGIGSLLNAPNSIHYVLMDDNNHIWFYINTGSTGFLLSDGESQIVNWEIYFRSGEVSQGQ